MDDASLLIWGMVLGAIGLGFFVYGKKQKAIVPLCTGIGLFVIPYIITSLTTLLIAAAILIVLPYFLKI